MFAWKGGRPSPRHTVAAPVRATWKPSRAASVPSAKCDGWTPNEILPIEPCDSGPLVRKIQRALRDAGYPVQVDGFNGPGTVRAIALFQKDRNLRRSGIVDQTTLDALGVK